MNGDMSRRLASEAVGTAMLLAVVIGSGIMGERLSGGNVAVALLANSIATGCGLFALITIFGPISGAHFNPVVTMVAAIEREVSWRDAGGYVVVQLASGFAGAAAAHLMFNEPLFSASEKIRTGAGQWFAEGAAAFGLVLVILAAVRRKKANVAAAVAVYITGAYWFTSSTSFANPAVTLARAATNTFAGIRPGDAPAFIAAQVVGGLAGLAFAKWLLRSRDPS